MRHPRSSRRFPSSRDADSADVTPARSRAGRLDRHRPGDRDRRGLARRRRRRRAATYPAAVGRPKHAGRRRAACAGRSGDRTSRCRSSRSARTPTGRCSTISPARREGARSSRTISETSRGSSRARLPGPRAAPLSRSRSPCGLVPHPIVTGLETSGLPRLGGYVVSAAAPGAETVLASHLDDPVLATGRAGLGKVAVYTADLGSDWSAQPPVLERRRRAVDAVPAMADPQRRRERALDRTA